MPKRTQSNAKRVFKTGTKLKTLTALSNTVQIAIAAVARETLPIVINSERNNPNQNTSQFFSFSIQTYPADH